MGEKKRLYYFDNIKAILIFLVVFQHYLLYRDENGFRDCVTTYIALFHMPIFIFVSGLFHKNESIWKRISQLFVMYAIYNISLAVINRTACLSYINGAAWFLFALLIYSIITYVIKDIPWVFVLPILIVFYLIVSFDSGLIERTEYGYRIANWYIYYYLGYILDPKLIEKYLKKCKTNIIGGIILFSTTYLFGVFRYKVVDTYGTVIIYGGDTNHFLLKKAIYLGVTIVLMTGILMISPHSNLGKFTTKIGGGSLQIYYWHYILRYIITMNPKLKEVYFRICEKDHTCGMITSFIVSLLLSASLS